MIKIRVQKSLIYTILESIYLTLFRLSRLLMFPSFVAELPSESRRSRVSRRVVGVTIETKGQSRILTAARTLMFLDTPAFVTRLEELP